MGRELEYGKLKVTDRNGIEVPSEMGVTNKGTIQIAVNDIEATYPIVIDPLITGEPDAIIESNQADAMFGISVSGAGDINNDGYDDVIVGACQYDNGQTDEGAAFVYYGSSSGLGATPDMLESNQANACFGISVSGAGDIDNDGYDDVIVGAYLYDNGQTDEGAAFVYYGSSSGIGTTPDTIESNQADSNYGFSVSGTGDIDNDGYEDVIVGAYTYTNGQTDEGAAFVYYGSSSGIVTTPDILESNQAWAHLGDSVSGAGDIDNDGYDDVIVGVYFYTNGQSDEGAAFVYYGSSSGIGTTPDILESNQANAYLGISVSGAGDIDNDGYDDVMGGAYTYTDGQTDEGAAFVYYGSSSGIGTTPDILESNQANSDFGYSVSGVGDIDKDGYDDVIVGADKYDNGQTGEGTAFVYYGSSSGIGTTPDILESDQANAYFGISVSGAGDINNDGDIDVIVGAYYYDNGQTDEGAFFVYLGGIAVESLTHNSTDPLTVTYGNPHQTVTWSATAAGGSGQYEYQYWAKGPETGDVWQKMQDWGENNQYIWSVDDSDVGLTSFNVKVRDTVTGNQASKKYSDFEVKYPPLVFGSISHNSTDPLTVISGNPAQTVTWSATATGGSGQYEYQYWAKGPETGDEWQKMQDWGESSQYGWSVDDSDEGLTSLNVKIRDVETSNIVSGKYDDFEVIVQ